MECKSQTMGAGDALKVTIAIDSFKGSVSSLEAGNAVKAGILRADPSAVVTVRGLADGGEGTVDALVDGLGGRRVYVKVKGPLGDEVEACYGILPDGITAVMEMAAASGLDLIPVEKRNPLYTTTFGVGQMIENAIKEGCKRFIVGIGGSATNDGGTGMLRALGYKFLDKDNNQVEMGSLGLKDLVRIDDSSVLPQLKDCTFMIACDVNNPLCGPNGCSAIYGPQKGATPKMVEEMDGYLKHYSEVTKAYDSSADDLFPGTGAAGGLGYAFLNFLKGTLKSGIAIIIDETKLEDYVKDADLVITGEGRIDKQTSMGKAPSGVAKLAKKYGAPVFGVAGGLTKDAYLCHNIGIDAVFSCVPGIMSLEEAMKKEVATENLTNAGEEIFRVFLAGRASAKK